MKTIIWSHRCLEIIKSFPTPVRQTIGYLINRLSKGEYLNLPHSRAMSNIGKGCFEIRVKGKDGIYRVFYYSKIKDKIIIFHAFQKKTQKTPKKEIEKAKKALKEILNE